MRRYLSGFLTGITVAYALYVWWKKATDNTEPHTNYEIDLREPS